MKPNLKYTDPSITYSNKNCLQIEELNVENELSSDFTELNVTSQVKGSSASPTEKTQSRRRSISVNDMMLDISAQKALLRSSILTTNGEGMSFSKEQSFAKDLSLGSTRVDDEIMSNRSNRSKRFSFFRKKSSLSNLDDLSYMSGQMSLNMSLADSGLFSMSETEFTDWEKKANEWEMEAEMEERLCQDKPSGYDRMDD